MRRPLLPLSVLVAASLLAVPGCRLEVRDLAGTGGRGETAEVETVVRALYGALSAHDTTALDTTALPAATAALGGASEGYMVPVHALWDVPGPRVGGDARIVRVDVRPDAGVATARVVLASRLAGALVEGEAGDVLTFVHRDGAWRLAHAALGAWRGRPAP